jgi:hypothetical protein
MNLKSRDSRQNVGSYKRSEPEEVGAEFLGNNTGERKDQSKLERKGEVTKLTRRNFRDDEGHVQDLQDERSIATVSGDESRLSNKNSEERERRRGGERRETDLRKKTTLRRHHSCFQTYLNSDGNVDIYIDHNERHPGVSHLREGKCFLTRLA